LLGIPFHQHILLSFAISQVLPDNVSNMDMLSKLRGLVARKNLKPKTLLTLISRVMPSKRQVIAPTNVSVGQMFLIFELGTITVFLPDFQDWSRGFRSGTSCTDVLSAIPAGDQITSLALDISSWPRHRGPTCLRFSSTSFFQSPPSLYPQWRRVNSDFSRRSGISPTKCQSYQIPAFKIATPDGGNWGFGCSEWA